jgi:hypothetical protein
MLAQLKLAAILRVCYLAVIPLLVLPGCGGGAASTTNGGNGNGGGTSNVSVSVSPKRAAVAMTAQTQQFTAPVTGDSQNRGISGSVDGTAGGNATVGSISSSGLYTPQQAVAPLLLPASPMLPTVPLLPSPSPTMPRFSLIATSSPRGGTNTQAYGLTLSNVTAGHHLDLKGRGPCPSFLDFAST